MKVNFPNIRDVAQLLKYLDVVFRKLSFADNFNGFIVERIEIPANTEISVNNAKRASFKYYTVLWQQGNGLLTAGDQVWDRQSLSLKNNGSNDIIVSVLFS